MKQNAREFPLQLFRDAVDKADHRARMALFFPIDRGAFFTRADAEIVVLGDGDEGGAGFSVRSALTFFTTVR